MVCCYLLELMGAEEIVRAFFALRNLASRRTRLEQLPPEISDPGNTSVTLQTLTRAAHAIGRDLRIELV